MSAGARRSPSAGSPVPSVDLSATRALATGSVGVTLVASGSVLYHVSNVAGRPDLLVALLAAAIVAATLLARSLSPRPALGLSAGLIAVGAYVYFASLPAGTTAADLLAPVVADSLSLLTGLSVLRIVNAGTWALAVAPGPTFLAWYLTVRRRHVAAATVAGGLLSVFVLTGDASPAVALLGAVGVAGAMGFGDLDRLSDGIRADEGAAETVAADVDDARRGVLVQLAGVVAVTSTVSVVPGGAAATFGGGDGADVGGGGTLEASLLSVDDELAVRGSISLSPKVRFTVTADGASYWHVGSYDRYTGDGWVRTGTPGTYTGSLSPPPGRSRVLAQEYRVETETEVMPAAWKPAQVSDAGWPIETTDGAIAPVAPLDATESYAVTSRVPVATASELRSAGTDYPASVVERYTRLPENTPDRVAERTARITANAENPYDTARVIEQWLENNRDYSLEVDPPSGDVADAFLFEMEAGYCTYFATTMVAMLRTRGIPARFAVGYTPGERVARDRWVIRGLNAHAWVEAFFPGHGWIRFDPTPAEPRETVEAERLATARENDAENVDTGETGPEPWTPTPETTSTTPTPGNETAADPGLVEGQATPDELEDRTGLTDTPTPGGGGLPSLPDLPTREQAALGAVVLAGAVAGLQRTGATERAYRAAWVHYQPRTEPTADVRRAYRRAEYVLARARYGRRPGETVREYLAVVGDERATRLGELYERATYAGRADEALADEAVALADDIVADHSRLSRSVSLPLPRRAGRSGSE